ncbi:MAG: ABC transporter permease [Chloroflexi bacterium]|nr:ABC transporter permease [Chloroflexota bacterium]
MGKYIVRRLINMVPVLFILSIFIFALIRLLPGDPIFAIIGQEAGNMDAETIARWRHDLGLDKPIPVQYLDWLSDVVRGDWGKSSLRELPVIDEVKQRFPITFQLSVVAWIMSLVIAIPIGIIAAVKRNSKLDVISTGTALTFVALPHFWLAIMLILLFGVVLDILPTFGWVDLWDNPWEWFRHMILPAFTLASGLAAQNLRQTRSAMLEVMAEDYIRTARAKGLRNTSIVWLHALKNALLPVVTVAGMQIGRIMGGTIITETIFSVPGMGMLAVNSVLLRDYTVVQMVVLLLGLTVLVANLVTDLLYAYLDPRIRYA